MVASALTKAQLEDFLNALSDRLAENGLRAEIHIGGGAALALRGWRESVRDIDYWATAEDEKLLRVYEAQICKRLGIEKNTGSWFDITWGPWMAKESLLKRDEDFLPYPLAKQKMDKGLKVFILKDDLLLATKLMRFQLTDADIRDIDVLARHLDVRSEAALTQLWNRNGSKLSFITMWTDLIGTSIPFTWKEVEAYRRNSGVNPDRPSGALPPGAVEARRADM